MKSSIVKLRKSQSKKKIIIPGKSLIVYNSLDSLASSLSYITSIYQYD